MDETKIVVELREEVNGPNRGSVPPSQPISPAEPPPIRSSTPEPSIPAFQSSQEGKKWVIRDGQGNRLQVGEFGRQEEADAFIRDNFQQPVAPSQPETVADEPKAPPKSDTAAPPVQFGHGGPPAVPEPPKSSLAKVTAVEKEANPLDFLNEKGEEEDGLGDGRRQSNVERLLGDLARRGAQSVVPNGLQPVAQAAAADVGEGLSAAAAAGDEFAGAAIAAAGAATAVAAGITAAGAVLAATVVEANRLIDSISGISPQVAVAQAEQDVQHIQNMIQRSSILGNDAAEFLKSQTRLTNTIEKIETQLGEVVLPVASATLDILDGILKSVSEASSYLLPGFRERQAARTRELADQNLDILKNVQQFFDVGNIRNFPKELREDLRDAEVRIQNRAAAKRAARRNRMRGQ